MKRIVAMSRFLALAWLFAFATCAPAQDARTSGAQTTAREWLKLADVGDAQKSWDRAGPLFRKAMSVDVWASSLHKGRMPFGAVQRRTIDSTRFATSFPGAPIGDYALVEFATIFANKSGAIEVVTLQFDPKGAWQVVGYAIR